MDGSDALADGEYTAVIDRFEDDLAVLEVETEDGLRQLVVERDELPEDARHADAVVEVTTESGVLVEAVYDEAASRERSEEAQSRFDRLSRRLGSDEDADDS
ncbi:DUF3006 domain-containing protein [Halobaculum lipolyticum]|uniref:DUF3006 domain-containing protein n=1 Tax=Halobaculum lipolyticum TaxID=3032001 RepID=A0ABD5WC16_9EURY|nr:DUF3006 domain-containing protein [Halobaculum sp. DT31]